MKSRLWPETVEQAVRQFISSLSDLDREEILFLSSVGSDFDHYLPHIIPAFGLDSSNDTLLTDETGVILSGEYVAGIIVKQAVEMLLSDEWIALVTEENARAFEMNLRMSHLSFATFLLSMIVGEDDDFSDAEREETIEECMNDLYAAVPDATQYERSVLSETIHRYETNDRNRYSPGYIISLALHRITRYDLCAEYALAWLDEYAEDRETYFILAYCYFSTGKLTDELALYRHMIEQGLADATTWNNMGVCLFNQQRYAEAIECYKKGLALEPNYALAYNNMGESYFKSGEIDKALTYYGISMTLNPNFGEVHRLMGNALLEKGYDEAFIQCYQRAALLGDATAKQYLKKSGLSWGCGKDNAREGNAPGDRMNKN